MINVNYLKKSYDKHNIYDINISENDLNDNKNLVMKEISDINFCPDNIKTYLKISNRYYNISSQYGINFHVFFDDTTTPIMYTLLKAYKQAIILKEYFNINTNFEIFIIMSPYKRYISSDEIIKAKHINGGFTSHKDNKIFIIRSEEFAKVILHEILHHVTHIDNKDKWNNSHIIKLKLAFNISPKTILIPNESIVELWATIFYCMFLSFHYKIPYNIILNKELDYSIQQYHKILNHQNNKEWFEYTNAYCYIVFKTILLANIKKYNIIHNDMDKIVSLLIEYKDTIPKKRVTNKKSLRMLSLSDY